MLNVYKTLYILCDAFGLVVRRESLGGFSLAIHQELREIPFDALCSEDSRLFVDQELVQRMGTGPIHVNLGKQRKSNSVARLTKSFDLGLRAGFLPPEL